MPTLALSRAVLGVQGVEPADLQGPELTATAADVLAPLLRDYGFDTSRPIRVRELPQRRGYHLTQ